MNNRRILHIEDDVNAQALIRDALQDIGELVQTETMEQALNLLHNDSFSLMILDFTLPDGSGQSLLHDIKTLINPPKVIVLSGHELVKNMPGVDLVLTKGRYQMRDLIAYVKDILDNA